MDKSTKNNWEKLGQKISEYEPNEFSPADWEEMDKMLESTPENRPLNGLFFKGIMGLFALLLVGYFIVPKMGIAPTVHQKEEANILNGQTEKNTAIDKNHPNPEGSPLQAENGPNLSGNAEKGDIPTTISNEIEPQNGQEKAAINTAVQPENAANEKNGRKNSTGERKRNGADNSVKNGSINSDKKLADETLNTVFFENGFENKNQENKTEKIGLDDKNKTLSENGTMPELKDIILNRLPDYKIQPLLFTAQSMAGFNNFSVLPIERKANRKIRFGALAGLNTAITDYDSLTFSASPFIGLFVNKRISDKWTLQAEAHLKFVGNYHLTQSWEHITYNSTGQVGYERITQSFGHLTSLDFPLILKYTMSKRADLFGGARFSYLGLTHAGFHGSYGLYSGVNPQESLSAKVPDVGFWKYDVNLVLGVDFYLTSRWVADLRYNQGFLDITPDNLYKDNALHLNSDLQFSLRYIF